MASTNRKSSNSKAQTPKAIIKRLLRQLFRYPWTRSKKSNMKSVTASSTSPDLKPTTTSDTNPVSTMPVSLDADGEDQTEIGKRVQKVVVAIDYGTTFSGAAYNEAMYRVKDGIYEPEIKGSSTTIPKIVAEWPSMKHGRFKIPSTIAYKKGTVPEWGYKVQHVMKTSPSDYEIIEWAKLLLEPVSDDRHDVHSPIRDARVLVETEGNACPTKDIQVIADYLSPFWKHAKQYADKLVSREQGVSIERIVIMTIPAKWSWEATGRTHEAANLAGLESKDSNSDYTFYTIKEPEAAAVYILQDMNRTSLLNVRDCFIICDAGGGTIDLVCYSVNNTEPLMLEEIIEQTSGIGANGNAYGSSHPDNLFKDWIRSSLPKGCFYNIKPEHMMKIMRRWEKVKENFGGEEGEYSIRLYPAFEDDFSDTDSNIRNGHFILQKTDMELFFAKALNKIEIEIEAQIRILKSQKLSRIQDLKALILVGGLGRNQYLQRKLQERYNGNPKLEIRNPDKNQTSVCYGAIQSVLNKDTEVTHISPYNIGYIRENGDLKWLIRRGENFRPGEIHLERMDFVLSKNEFANKDKFLNRSDIELFCFMLLTRDKEPRNEVPFCRMLNLVLDYTEAEKIGPLELFIPPRSLAHKIDHLHEDLEFVMVVEIHLMYGRVTFKYGLDGQPMSKLEHMTNK